MPGGGGSEIIANNVAYFSATGSPNGTAGLTMTNCTFEAPCGPNDFTQSNVNTLNSLLPSTQMFFNGGTYNAVNGTSALTLNNGQGAFGTIANYSAPASGAARPTFNGAFILSGNNTLDSIILNNNLGATATAITSTGGQNIMIRNSTIGSAANPYGVGMNLMNANVSLVQSSVNVNATITPLFPVAAGIFLSNSTLLVQSSPMNMTGNSLQNNVAIALTGNSVLQLIASQLTMNISNAGSANQVDGVIGIFAENTSMVSINNNSTVNVSGVNNSTQYTLGLGAENQALITMNGGSLNVSNTPPGGNAVLISVQVKLSGVTCTLNNTPGC
jgi:hypothetical protein